MRVIVGGAGEVKSSIAVSFVLMALSRVIRREQYA